MKKDNTGHLWSALQIETLTFFSPNPHVSFQVCFHMHAVKCNCYDLKFIHVSPGASLVRGKRVTECRAQRSGGPLVTPLGFASTTTPFSLTHP